MSAWILLRGLTREARHWADFPDRLHAAGFGDAIVGADLPGSGRWFRERSPSSIGATTDFLRDRLANEGYAPPYRIIALSLGAMVAVDWAQRFPGEVERMVLINTSLARLSTPFERVRPSAWPMIAWALGRWHSRRAAEAVVHRLTCNRTDSRDTDLSMWAAIYESAPPTRTNALRQLYAAARFWGPPAALHCPVLILASRTDALVHCACSSKLAAQWGATLIEHPWAGHDLPHDDPAWVAETIAAWVGNALAVAAPPTSA